MKFGVFNSFWDGQPNHLPFLSLEIDQSETGAFSLGKSLDLISKIISENADEDIHKGINLMLADSNWRIHLVSFMVILKLNQKDQIKFIHPLWKMLCLGTWVSPQLVVILSKLDSNFKQKSKRILDNKNLTNIQLEYLEDEDLKNVQFGFELAESKILSSLNYLVEGSLLKVIEDDNGAKIAENWNKQLIKLHNLNLITYKCTS